MHRRFTVLQILAITTRLLTTLLLSYQLSHAQTPLSPLLEIKQGTLPLIFTVPHGGTLKPNQFMNRRYGSLTTDAQTKELALEIDLAIQSRLGASAHFIISNLHRSKMDPNRDITEAAQDDPFAQESWHAFHAACSTATQRVSNAHGPGLLIDLHGHRHEEPNVELGMLLTSADLQHSDAHLSSNSSLLAKSSIRSLVQFSKKPFAELVRGPSSLGSLLEVRGQRSLPSAVRTQPSPGASYYSGAYIIATHGSKNGSPISAIQVECPWDGVRDTPANRKQFAERLTDALAEFLSTHLNWPPK